MTLLDEFCGSAGTRPVRMSGHRHLCLLTRNHLADGRAHRCRQCGHEWWPVSEADRAMLAVLEEQLNTLRLDGLAVSNVNVVVQTEPSFLDGNRQFRITGELVEAEARPTVESTPSHAVWDDGHQVSIPGKLLAELEVAWRGAQSWSIARQYPDPLHDDAAFLDHVEQDLTEEVVRGAVKAGRALLTNSGPAWSVRPASYAEVGHQVDFAVAAESFEWQRGTPLPYLREHGPTWLMCRMSGLSIPLLPAEAIP